MRGMTHGLLGFASFLTVVAATLVQWGILASFAAACAGAGHGLTNQSRPLSAPQRMTAGSTENN